MEFFDELLEDLGVKEEAYRLVLDSVATSPNIFVGKRPQRGDHIRVKRDFNGIPYYHHGIYVSDNEVYCLDGEYEIEKWEDARVTCCSLELFLKGGNVEVREYSEEQKAKKCSVEETIANIGRYNNEFKGYDLMFKNCECFANACVFNRKESGQVKKVVKGALATAAALALAALFIPRKGNGDTTKPSL